jgi:hypothetical protein
MMNMGVGMVQIRQGTKVRNPLISQAIPFFRIEHMRQLSGLNGLTVVHVQCGMQREQSFF